MMIKNFAQLLLCCTLSGCLNQSDTGANTTFPIEDEKIDQNIEHYPAYSKFFSKKLSNDVFDVWSVEQNSNGLAANNKNIWIPHKRYGWNFHLIDDDTYNGWIKNANLDASVLNKKAIVIYPTDIRALPTREPMFEHTANVAGEGYPFDCLQHHRLTPCTPIRIRHYSQDGLWAFVVTPYKFGGFVLRRDIAEITEAQAKTIKSYRFGIIQKDHVCIKTQGGKSLYTVRLGTRFPINAQGQALIPCVNNGILIWNQSSVLSNEVFSSFPLKMNEKNVHMILKSLGKGQYGWGTMFDHRDCSSILMDLYAPFGLFLPRNSQRQIDFCKHVQNLEGLTLNDKKAIILKKGIPFLTLLYAKGHIALYVGVYQNEPIIFHSRWGVPLLTSTGLKGRNIIGRPLLTRINFGAEIQGIDNGEVFWKNCSKMGYLFE